MVLSGRSVNWPKLWSMVSSQMALRADRREISIYHEENVETVSGRVLRVCCGYEASYVWPTSGMMKASDD